jgi:DNA-binding NarL/FixJ family response regulator
MSRTSEVGSHASRPQETDSISVGIVDDDAIVRAWVRMSLEGSEFRVAGEAKNAKEALTLIERRRPDLLLVDYDLPDESGAELVRRLRDQGENARVLLFTASPKTGLNELALEAGAQGAVVKQGDREVMLTSLRKAARGSEVIDTSHPRREAGTSLSPREGEVLRRAAGGATNAEIAKSLGVGFESVKTLLRRAYIKLNARNRIEAIEEARRRGLV